MKYSGRSLLQASEGNFVRALISYPDCISSSGCLCPHWYVSGNEYTSTGTVNSLINSICLDYFLFILLIGIVLPVTYS